MAAVTSLDGVTAATKLRREKLEVEAELKEKRAEYARRMERVREREEALKHKRQALQADLVSFYKYIQENEIKRNRANKKALQEEKMKQDRHEKCRQLQDQLKELEQQKATALDRYRRFVRYQTYLLEVLDKTDNEDGFQEPKELILRYHTLDDNRRVLQQRKELLESNVSENKQKLTSKEKRNKTEEVALQNQLSMLQNQLESAQKKLKNGQDAFEQAQQAKGQNVKTMGQVRMACQNLYDRCLRFTAQFRERVTRKEEQTDVLVQLGTIGDCLEDFHACIADWKRKLKEQKSAEAAAAGAGAAALAAGGVRRVAARTV